MHYIILTSAGLEWHKGESNFLGEQSFKKLFDLNIMVIKCINLAS